jgi:hypothetical protein
MQNLPHVLSEGLLERDPMLQREQFDNLKEGMYYYVHAMGELPIDYIVKVLYADKDARRVAFEYVMMRDYKKIVDSYPMTLDQYIRTHPAHPNELDEAGNPTSDYTRRIVTEFRMMPDPDPLIPDEWQYTRSSAVSFSNRNVNDVVNGRGFQVYKPVSVLHSLPTRRRRRGNRRGRHTLRRRGHHTVMPQKRSGSLSRTPF